MRKMFSHSSRRFLLSVNAQLFDTIRTIGQDVSILLDNCSQALLDTWLETDHAVAIYLQQVEKYDALAH